jgi:hypothetical protein
MHFKEKGTIESERHYEKALGLQQEKESMK